MEQTSELDIKRYVGLIVKRRYLFTGVAAALISLIFAVTYSIPPVYEAKTIVSVEKNFLNDIMKGLAVAPSIDDKVNALATIMKSRTLVYKVISDMDLELNRKSEIEVEGLIERFQAKTDIKIEFNKSSRKDIDFFTVSFRHRNPKTARDYVNTLVGRYIEENLGAKRESSVGANRFLLDQINHYKSKVGNLEAEIISLGKDQAVVLYDKLTELQRRQAELLVQYTENHPEVVKVQNEIAAIKVQANAARKATPGETRSGAFVKNRIVALERERDTYKKIYEELAAAYGKSEVSTQADMQDKAGTFRIVDPAVLPLKPVSPDRVKIMLLGLAGGLAGSLGLLMLLDMTDKTVKSVDPLKTLGIPVLAIISRIPDPGDAVRVRKKDALLYGCSGVFIAALAVLIVREAIG